MTRIPPAGTDLSREILDQALGKQPRESATEPQQPTTVAEQIQDTIDHGMPLDVIRRRFHLSASELRDYCDDIMDDGADDSDRSPSTGY